jgi:hypothetical protein
VKNMMLSLIALIALSASALHSQDKTDSSPHTVQFVTVDKDVKLEVLDWGGTGHWFSLLVGEMTPMCLISSLHSPLRPITSMASRVGLWRLQ